MKKKILSLFLVLAMLIAVMPTGIAFAENNGAAATVEPSKPQGGGTEKDPYIVSTAAELYWIAGLVNNTLTDGTAGNGEPYVELGADIYVNGDAENPVLNQNGELNPSGEAAYNEWTPIGIRFNRFNGSFDGKGHFISGIVITTGDDGIGLFGWVGRTASCQIKNLGIKDSYISAPEGVRVGGLIGDLIDGTITDCYSECTVKGGEYIGGLVGFNTGGTITSCYSKSNVTGTVNGAGGFAGFNDYGATIKNSYSISNVTGAICVGGFVGTAWNIVENCYSSGTVSGTGKVGGFAGGYGARSEIKGCYSICTVSGTGSVGGFIGGQRPQKFQNCCYLKDSNAAGTTYNSGAATALSAEEFASGKATYILNGDQMSLAYGQKIGADPYPVFMKEADKAEKTVYATSGCATYNNNGTTSEKAHGFGANGVCTTCGKIETAEPGKDSDGVYQIGTAKELYWFAEYVNAGNVTADAKLTADITINSNVLKADGETLSDNSATFKEWVPIGNYDKSYNGFFDGDGHVISGLYINSLTNYVGLFGRVYDGSIVRVGVTDSYIKGIESVGGICGSQQGFAGNCFFSGVVSGEDYVGGLVGNGYATNSYTTAKVIGTGENVNGLNGDNSYFLTNGEATKTGKTVAQFESGEVCYLLSKGTGDISGDIWGQEIGKDTVPRFGGKKVYATTGCVTYTNDSTVLTNEHDYDANEICKNCGKRKMFDLKKPDQNEDGVYQISSKEELYWFAELVNGTLTDGTAQDLAANAELTADIKVNDKVFNEDGSFAADVSKFYPWTPIGSVDIATESIVPYLGTFDGKGHTISGLYALDEESACVGLFGFVGGNVGKSSGNSMPVVKNLTIKDSYFNGGFYTGAISGVLLGAMILNCANYGYVTCSGQFAGGICALGENSAVVSCANYGYVKGTGTSTQIGGVALVDTMLACLNVGTLDNGARTIYAVGPNGSYMYGYYLASCIAGGRVEENSGIAVTAEEFATGEAAFYLRIMQTGLQSFLGQKALWGQKLTGEDSDPYPVLGSSDNVYLVKGSFTNSIPTEFEIAEGESTGAVINIPKAGKYTVVFADYEDGALYDVYSKEITVGEDEIGDVVVSSDSNNGTIGTGDKIMLWDGLDTMKPLCDAYVGN